jgi:cation diffusion facilitator CzcD-associated flavoprotein CzcO
VADRVDVYQRTPPYILPKPDRAHGEPGLADRVPALRKAERLRTFLYGELLTTGFVLSPKFLAAPMRMWRRQLDEQVTDPELRGKCVPDYVMGCKRVLFSNDWYPTLVRSNVELITDPIERIAADGVVTAGGVTRPADVIVYGTGFQTLDFLAPMEVTGRDGRSLRELWHDGAQAYLGISVAEFPNFFMLYGPNTNLGGNSIIYMLEGQIQYVLTALQTLEREGLDWLDVRPDVQRSFNAWVDKASRTSVWESGCRSWYTTDAGRNTNNWPDHTFLYRYRIRRFDLAKYRVMPRSAPVTPAGDPA